MCVNPDSLILGEIRDNRRALLARISELVPTERVLLTSRALEVVTWPLLTDYLAESDWGEFYNGLYGKLGTVLINEDLENWGHFFLGEQSDDLLAFAALSAWNKKKEVKRPIFVYDPSLRFNQVWLNRLRNFFGRETRTFPIG